MQSSDRSGTVGASLEMSSKPMWMRVMGESDLPTDILYGLSRYISTLQKQRRVPVASKMNMDHPRIRNKPVKPIPNGRQSVKTNGNANREGKQPEMRRRGVLPSPSHRKQTATEPVSQPRCVESKCQRRGFPIHVTSKTNLPLHQKSNGEGETHPRLIFKT